MQSSKSSRLYLFNQVLNRRLLQRWLKPLTHLGALLPLAVLIWDALTNNLTINPIQAATQRTGRIALTILLLSLSCTPLASVLGFKEALKLRRPLGLYAFLYASLHFLIFFGLDYGLNLQLVAAELREKRYIIAGFSAGVILALLASTSFQYWMKRLGKNWKRLHRLVYLAGLLAVVHYAWAVKADIRLPLLYGAILILLLLMRLSVIKRTASILWQKLVRRVNQT